MPRALRNLLTDVPGLRVGHAHDATICTGVSVVVPDAPAVAAVDVRGGGPGTRETDALGLSATVEQIHGLVLSGGSAFGLSAATGVQMWLRNRGVGFDVGGQRIPIVPQAILFDLLNGGDKQADGTLPYESLAAGACEALTDAAFPLGSVGAGYGATTADFRGGLGSASQALGDEVIVGALVAVNAVGSAVMGKTGCFWANPFERGNEYGGRGAPENWDDAKFAMPLKGRQPAQNTTLGIIATNAHLTKAQAARVAIMAQTGLARALRPVHSPLDGDVVFCLATGTAGLDRTRFGGEACEDELHALTVLGSAGADVLARAVAIGVYNAAPAPAHWTGPPAYCEVF